MPKIIPLENEIKNLENFLQSYDKDDRFKEFANAFILAVDENKNKINVNDINQINELIMQNRSQENAEFIYNSLIFVDDLARDGVINYQNLSSEVNTKIHNEVELNKTLDLIAEQIEQQKPKVEPKTDYSNLNFVEILQNNGYTLIETQENNFTNKINNDGDKIKSYVEKSIDKTFTLSNEKGDVINVNLMKSGKYLYTSQNNDNQFDRGNILSFCKNRKIRLDDLLQGKAFLENKPKQDIDDNAQISKPKQPIIADDEEQKLKLSNELENELQANAILRNTTIPISEIINNPSYNKSEISPDEVIKYIKDDKQIYYPFDMDKTLDNKDFMRDFHGKIKTLNNNEIKEMITHLRAKNEALRKIINAQEPNERTELDETLNKELSENKELNKQAEENIKRQFKKWTI